MRISRLRRRAGSQKIIEARVRITNFRQEDVRDREFEGERRMERDIDQHTLGAGVRRQEPREVVDAARNVWAGAGR